MSDWCDLCQRWVDNITKHCDECHISDVDKALKLHYNDCERIHRIAKRCCMRMSLKQVAKIWAKHSCNFDYEWMNISSDEEIEMVLDSYYDEIKKECPHCGKSLEHD